MTQHLPDGWPRLAMRGAGRLAVGAVPKIVRSTKGAIRAIIEFIKFWECTVGTCLALAWFVIVVLESRGVNLWRFIPPEGLERPILQVHAWIWLALATFFALKRFVPWARKILVRLIDAGR